MYVCTSTGVNDYPGTVNVTIQSRDTLTRGVCMYVLVSMIINECD